jgi:hypothetical protein
LLDKSLHCHKFIISEEFWTQPSIRGFCATIVLALEFHVFIEEANLTIHPAFCGHGIFTEFPGALLERYDGWHPKAQAPGAGGAPAATPTDALIRALRYMNVPNVWIYAFGRSGMINGAVTGPLVDALRKQKFNLAAWGYCSTKNIDAALQHADDIKKTYAIDAFIADVEPYNTGDDDWQNQDAAFDRLIDGLVQRFGTDNLGISIAPPWLKLDAKNDKKSLVTKHLVRRAANRISVLAPQVYWMDYPKKTATLDQYGDTGLSEADYPEHDPEAYARMCIQCWRAAGIELPLIVSGQTYWSTGESTPTRPFMEAQLAKFIATFSKWKPGDFVDRNVIGMNWYHAGQLDANGEGSMSDGMIEGIAAAHFDKLPYAAQTATVPVA